MKAILSVFTVAVCAMFVSGDAFALIDHEKLNRNKKKELTQVYEVYKAQGSAPATGKYAKVYDTNQDGRIDSTEAQALQQFIGA